MSPTALIVTYHSVGDGAPPLSVDRALFEQHLDVIVRSGCTVLTVGALADALRAGPLPSRAVALTFDDGLADVVEAADVLAGRGLAATVFCVSRRLGGTNDWPGQPHWVPRARLADAGELASLAAMGWEIGSHGTEHASLRRASPSELVTELIHSRAELEEAVGVPVTSFAYPYGRVNRDGRKALAAAGYRAACSTRPEHVSTRTDAFLLPRVDAHYLRNPARLDAALRRASLYLRVRGIAASARRLIRPDDAPGRGASA